MFDLAQARDVVESAVDKSQESSEEDDWENNWENMDAVPAIGPAAEQAKQKVPNCSTQPNAGVSY